MGQLLIYKVKICLPGLSVFIKKFSICNNICILTIASYNAVFEDSWGCSTIPCSPGGVMQNNMRICGQSLQLSVENIVLSQLSPCSFSPAIVAGKEQSRMQ